MSTKAQNPKRLEFVDSLRGLAVLFMVPLHTSHGWVRPDARHGVVWTASQFFGGLAAPIFLTLAGVSLGLQWANAQERGGRPNTRRDLARALQLIVLGYLLRLQMWIIDGAGYAKPSNYLAQALLLIAYGLAYHGFGQLPTHARRGAILSATAIVPFGVAMQVVSLVAPDRARSLLRVDVLQCIGASLLLLTALGAVRRERFAGARFYIVAAIAVALSTGWMRSWVPGPLPEAIAGYIGQWAPSAGRPIMGLFPLFPWFAYALLGAALGLTWGREPDARKVETHVIGLVAIGAAIGLVTSESWPPIYQLLRQHEWLTQPVRVMYRVGLVLALLGLALAASRRAVDAPATPLEVLGRASLLIYWVHLEFAFGAAARPIVRQLDWRGWALGSAALLAAMWLLAYARIGWPRLRFQARNIATN